MKVAFVSFDFGEYCVRLASGIAQSAHVHLFLPTCEGKPYAQLLDQSVDLRLFHKPRLRQPLRQLQMVTSLVRQIRALSPDVVHLQAGQLWFNWALPMLGNRPLVLTVHDPAKHLGDGKSWKTPDYVRDMACFHATERIVHAPQMKDLLLQRLPIDAVTVHVVPHVLLGDDTAQEHVSEDEQLILFFGRLWEYKGLEYLIRAEPLITSRVPRAKIVIAGTGQDFEYYRRMMVHPDKFIVYNEHVSDEKRAELFRRASVVVLPYVEASQSGVIPIAYRFRKPVVATTVGGLPAMVDDGQTGFLVPPRDEFALADALVRLLQDEKLRTLFGRNGRHKVDVECAPEVVARQTLLVYQRAMAGAHQSQGCRRGH
jgi:glycosyltransferase involved in cell wall biosynthesis